MDIDADINNVKIIENISFEIDAIPQENLISIATNTKAAPLNVRVRVRKKDDVDNMNEGLTIVPDVGTFSDSKQNLRMVSSDQTVLSFSMLMEADLRRKVSDVKYPKKRFYDMLKSGLCITTKSDDDLVPYSLSHATAEPIKTVSENNANQSTSQIYANSKYTGEPKRRKLFGKCKPGGCLDPPYGEDKYIYVQNVNKKAVDDLSDVSYYIKELIMISVVNQIKQSKEKRRSTLGSLLRINKLKAEYVQPKQKEENNEVSQSKTSETGSKVSLTINYSHSVLTYPPAITPSEMRLFDKVSGQHTKNNYIDEKLSKSSKTSEKYFIPPRKENILKENLSVVRSYPKQNNYIINQNKEKDKINLTDLNITPKIYINKISCKAENQDKTLKPDDTDDNVCNEIDTILTISENVTNSLKGKYPAKMTCTDCKDKPRNSIECLHIVDPTTLGSSNKCQVLLKKRNSLNSLQGNENIVSSPKKSYKENERIGSINKTHPNSSTVNKNNLKSISKTENANDESHLNLQQESPIKLLIKNKNIKDDKQNKLYKLESVDKNNVVFSSKGNIKYDESLEKKNLRLGNETEEKNSIQYNSFSLPVSKSDENILPRHSLVSSERYSEKHNLETQNYKNNNSKELSEFKTVSKSIQSDKISYVGTKSNEPPPTHKINATHKRTKSKNSNDILDTHQIKILEINPVNEINASLTSVPRNDYDTKTKMKSSESLITKQLENIINSESLRHSSNVDSNYNSKIVKDKNYKEQKPKNKSIESSTTIEQLKLNNSELNVFNSSFIEDVKSDKGNQENKNKIRGKSIESSNGTHADSQRLGNELFRFSKNDGQQKQKKYSENLSATKELLKLKNNASNVLNSNFIGDAKSDNGQTQERKIRDKSIELSSGTDSQRLGNGSLRFSNNDGHQKQKNISKELLKLNNNESNIINDNLIGDVISNKRQDQGSKIQNKSKELARTTETQSLGNASIGFSGNLNSISKMDDIQGNRELLSNNMTNLKGSLEKIEDLAKFDSNSFSITPDLNGNAKKNNDEFYQNLSQNSEIKLHSESSKTEQLKRATNSELQKFSDDNDLNQNFRKSVNDTPYMYSQNNSKSKRLSRTEYSNITVLDEKDKSVNKRQNEMNTISNELLDTNEMQNILQDDSRRLSKNSDLINNVDPNVNEENKHDLLTEFQRISEFKAKNNPHVSKDDILKGYRPDIHEQKYPNDLNFNTVNSKEKYDFKTLQNNVKSFSHSSLLNSHDVKNIELLRDTLFSDISNSKTSSKSKNVFRTSEINTNYSPETHILPIYNHTLNDNSKESLILSYKNDKNYSRANNIFNEIHQSKKNSLINLNTVNSNSLNLTENFLTNLRKDQIHKQSSSDQNLSATDSFNKNKLNEFHENFSPRYEISENNALIADQPLIADYSEIKKSSLKKDEINFLRDTTKYASNLESDHEIDHDVNTHYDKLLHLSKLEDSFSKKSKKIYEEVQSKPNIEMYRNIKDSKLDSNLRSLKLQDYEAKSNAMKLDLAFETFTNEDNIKVLKTLNPDLKYDSKNNNVTVIKSLIRDNSVLKIPLDETHDVELNFKNKTKEIINISSRNNNNDRSFYLPNQETNQIDTNDEVLYKTLRKIYEDQLLPLQKMINLLKEELESLASQQELTNANLLKSMKNEPIRLIDVRECQCYQSFDMR